MSARLLKYTFNGQVFVRENATTGTNSQIVQDGTDWANFVNDTDTTGVVESAPCMAPGVTQVIDLPPGITTAKAIAWRFSAKVNLIFSYGQVDNTRYGIQEGEFTTLSVEVPSSYAADVTGHIVILG